MFTTVEQAKREAVSRRKMQDNMNGPGEGCEFAYSPSFMTVGMRNVEEEEGSVFRVFNVGYPHHGIDKHLITDWVSVGISTPSRKPRQEDKPGTLAGYCVQCREAVTGKVGDFVYLRGVCVPKVAISPVFQSLADLYPWMKANGWQHMAGTPFDCVKIATPAKGKP